MAEINVPDQHFMLIILRKVHYVLVPRCDLPDDLGEGHDFYLVPLGLNDQRQPDRKMRCRITHISIPALTGVDREFRIVSFRVR